MSGRLVVELLFIALSGFLLNGAWGIRCNRHPEGVTAPKSVADNRFQIKISGNPDKYVPGGVYTVSLRGQRMGRFRPTFKRFMVVVEPSFSGFSHPSLNHRNVGSLSLVDDTLSKYSNECPNAIMQTSTITKNEVHMTWSAPPPGSGCVVFRATVVEDHDLWFMDDGPLSYLLCEDMQEIESDVTEEVEECCACDDAMYEMVFEGIWSKPTHPKDFPSNKWETAFTDMIGASHSSDFRFWEYGNFASKGLRQLAELGETHELESEVMDQAESVRTIIRARGLSYPNVTGKTYSVFRVDTKHHLMSIVSKIEPSPDWIVGVSAINLCLRNCSWVQMKVINLYPWDAGTDSGISYNSPNSPTAPQQTISRITPSYPNDPSSPFYDATGEEMKPLARLHLMRQQLYEKPCDGEAEEGADADAVVEEPPVECSVTEWSQWSPCSASCGKGERYRQRSYLHRKKARAMGCTEPLTERGECYASHESCGPGEQCRVTEWGPWSSCSVSCGEGIQTRTRRYRTRLEHRNCIELPEAPPLQETNPCVGEESETCEDATEEVDCPQTEWSTWSPCSASCGKGKSVRMLLPIDEEEGADIKPSEICPEVDTVEERDCFELPSCEINEDLFRDLCLSPLKEGSCHRNNSRWYFDPDSKTCQNFLFRGCLGNRNNFLTHEECEGTCIKALEELGEGDEEEEDTTLDGPIGGLWPASQIVDPKGEYGLQESTLPSHRFEAYTEPITAVDGPVVDCVVGRWTRWSACSVSCGNGYKTRNRKIVIHPRNGGKACPKVFKRKKCRKQCGDNEK